jgi:hypothetical protein
MSWVSASLQLVLFGGFVCTLWLHCVDDAGGCVALCQLVNVAPLCSDRVNSTIASVVCLGGRSVRIGGVGVLDRMEGQGRGGWGGLLLVGL